MADVKSTSLVTDLASPPDFSQTYFDKLLLARSEYYNFYSRWATKRPLKQKTGKNIVFRRYLHLNPMITALVEGEPPEGKTPNLDDYTATLSQYGDVIAITDFAEMTATDPFLNEFYELLGEQAGYSVDILYRDVAAAGTGNAVYSNGTARTSVTTILENNDLDRMIRSLRNNGAKMLLSGAGVSSANANMFPIKPAYPVVVHPNVMHDIQNISGYRSSEEYRNAGAMAPDEEGRYRNLAFFVAPDPDSLNAGAKVITSGGGTSSAVDNTSGTVDVYLSVVFAKDGFTVVPLDGTSTKTVTKPRGSAGTADPLNQLMTAGWITSLTSLRTNESWLGRFESGASL